ncbi:MAG TPA: hypothetical protein VJV79_12670 [Polyangiaceae bacterium]|nr:hypothetical protein [Polyangiaceae bacterium]
MNHAEESWLKMLGRIRCSKFPIVGALRVFALFGVVQLVGFALWARAAHARIGETLLSIGAGLMKLEDGNGSKEPRSLFLNGVTVHLRTATTEQDVGAVLGRFQAICRDQTGVQAPEAVLDKLRAGTSMPTRNSALLDGVIRVESPTEGAVACIDTGTKLSIAELTTRLQEFTRTGDLDAIGDLRYALARRVGDKTVVLTMWTEGQTPLLRMFPPTGDAPGRDPHDVPRAPNMRRLLSTWENGEPYSMTVYTAEAESPATLAGFYGDRLRGAGWAVDAKPLGASPEASSIVARRGAQTVMVRIGRDSHGSAAVSVSVLD